MVEGNFSVSQRITLRRRRAVASILAPRGDALLVTGLGSTTWDAFAHGDHDLNFYTWGGMGGAAMIGLGLAIAQTKRRVVVLTGDGEMLMGLGSLATIGVQRAANLAVVVIDNERYGETGQQETHTHFGVSIAGVGLASGFRDAVTAYTRAQLNDAIDLIYDGQGPVLAVVKVRPESEPLTLPDRDGPYLKGRFREALLGRASGP